MSRITVAVALGLCGLTFAEEPLGRYKAAPDADMWAQLEAIGYLDGVEVASQKSGVTVNSPAAHAGLNLYTSGHAPEATLMDMNGTVLHRWAKSYAEVFGAPKKDASEFHWWRRAHLLDDGSLLAVFEGKGLVKLDRNSEVVWRHKGRQHHDIEVLDDGTIVTLTRRPRSHGGTWRADDHITWLSSEGEVLRELSLLDVVDKTDLTEHYVDDPDVLHTNSIRVLDDSVDHPAFRAGNMLLSFRHLDAVAVLDPDSEELVWIARGDTIGQHDPSVIGPHTLLVYDNRGPRWNYKKTTVRESRVVELDVRDQSIGRSYSGSTETPFFSATCGAAQRLPNGNTLITETDRGRAFEVDRTGAIVWEFVSPHRAESDPTLIATLQEVERLPRTLGWLSQ